MDTLRYDTSGQETLQLGRQGESRARELRIDVADLLREWPGAEITLLHQRPGEEEIYPVAAELQETELVWLPTSADTALAGRGLAEVRATLDGVLAKSVMLRTKIVASLTGHETETPDPAKDWVDKVIQATQNLPVKDVQVAGSSVLDGGVANVPIAAETNYGVVKVFDWGGTRIDEYKRLCVFQSSINHIARRESRTVIVPENLDYAVKAAMCDGKGAAWTSVEQAAARERMGLDKQYELIEEIDVDEEGVSVVERNVDLARMYLMIIGASGHTGTCSIDTVFNTDHSFSAYWNLANVAAQYELIVENGIANGFYKFSNSGIGSTPSINGINLTAMKTIFSATSKPSKISRLTIAGNIPNGTKFILYGVRA